MDETIAGYINTAFSPELQELIFKSFDIFSNFNYTDVEKDFIDLIMDASYVHSEDLHDKFITTLNNKLDFIIEQHKLKLSPDATISQKIEFCNGLYRVQSLEDYTGISNALESMESNEEILSSIISDVTSFEQVDVYELVEEINPVFLTSLKSFVATKENNDVRVENTSVVTAVKYFFKLFERNSIGRELASVVLIGQKFNQYLSFVKEEITKGSDDDIGFNILSVLMLSEDGYNNPIIVYRKYSQQIIDNINKAALIEEIILKYVSQFNEFMKVQNEKNRIS